MGYNRVSDANEITARYMDSILIKQRLIDSVVADTSIDFLGERFDSPVMMPAFSHLGQMNGRDLTGLEEYSLATKELKILNFVGMMENDLFDKIMATGAKTVRIVKPYDDNGKVRDQMQYAEAAGAFGIQTFDMLESYVQSSKLPFFVKGVLSVEDAVKCADLGAKAIIISHHHGRLPYAVPPMMILPEIKEELEGRDVKIIVDCGIASGADVYKALALGADAAAVGRSMLPSLEADGTEGVVSFVRSVEKELRFIMSCTGYGTVSDIDDECLEYI